MVIVLNIPKIATIMPMAPETCKYEIEEFEDLVDLIYRIDWGSGC